MASAYDRAMTRAVDKAGRGFWDRAPFGHGVLRALRATWHIGRLGALVGALTVTPSTWEAPWRGRLARAVWQASGPQLTGFTLMSGLLSLVIIRIVVVTAQSYGLSPYALEMVVRVLVLELIPLVAALFVAMRVSLPDAAALGRMRDDDALARLRRQGVDILKDELTPRVLASTFAVLLLAAISSVLCLTLAYLLVHGLSPWGLDRFTRTVGRIFSPSVTLIFVMKTVALAFAVALVPPGSALHDARPASDARTGDGGLELAGMVRLLGAMLLVELVALAAHYA